MAIGDRILNYQGRNPNACPVNMTWVRGIMWSGLAILILLASAVLAFPWRTDTGDMRRRGTIAELLNLSTALDAYRVDIGTYPSTTEGLEALVTCPQGVTGWQGRYIDAVPMDKWGTAYRYQFPSRSDPEKFDLHSVGQDLVDATADDVTPFSMP